MIEVHFGASAVKCRIGISSGSVGGVNALEYQLGWYREISFRPFAGAEAFIFI